MRRGVSGWGAAALLLVALALTTAGGAGAQQATEQEIRESQRRLEQIRRERAQLREELTQARTRVNDLASELRILERQVGSSADALAELEFQVEQRQLQITLTTQELQAAQEELVRRKAVLHRRLRDIYKRGPLRDVQVLLTADSFGELINRYRYLLLIARHDRNLVHEIGSVEVQLVARERLLQRSLDELQQVQTEREEEHQQLDVLRKEQRGALSGAQARQQRASRRIAQLERDEQRLRSRVAEWERKRREAERLAAARNARAGATPAPTAGTLSTSDLGSLAWPVQGRLLYRFGRAPQANGTVLRRNGVGIGAAAGTPVRAVEAGTVVMAGPFEGYGPTVVLSHGGGYYSLYLYLRELSVREGDAVKRNQALGAVGGQGTPEGEHMEFQIRAPGGEAIDPLAWLQKRGPT
jgi:septal ring factor EnvC (AmiA/AmiB activator)